MTHAALLRVLEKLQEADAIIHEDVNGRLSEHTPDEQALSRRIDLCMQTVRQMRAKLQ